MENPGIISAYAEIGILGLCAVMMIILFYKSFKQEHKTHDRESDRVDKQTQMTQNQYAEMLKMIQDQQKEFMQQQMKQNEALLETIVDKVTTHTPTKEDNEKLLKISNEINQTLQDMLVECNATRASLVQYHNGGRGLNKQSFLKMSMTNEQIQVGVKPLMSEFKDQFRSTLAYFVNTIDDTGRCFISSQEELLEKDIGMYEFMKFRGSGRIC